MPSGQQEWLALLRRRGALLKGHFLLTSGRHTAEYLQCSRLFQQPADAERVGQKMADPFQGCRVDVVIGPAIGGIIVAHEVARALGCRAIFAEREQGKMTLRRGFRLEKGERVVVVEDVVTTGGSVQEVLEVAVDSGTDIVGIASVVNRSRNDSPFIYPFHPLVTMPIDTYEPDTCPLCLADDEPIVRPGSRELTY